MIQINLVRQDAPQHSPESGTTAVAPGMVMTEMARGLPADIIARAESEAVLGELARPEDVAAAVLFLLSDAAKAITGEVLRVDAGQYI